jgi:hypothetical protein
MESLYASLLCASFTFSVECVRIRSADRGPTGSLSRDQVLPMAALLYVGGLFVYFLYPTAAPPATTVALLCACLAAFGHGSTRGRKVQLCLIGLIYALAVAKLATLFPFHKWHGVPTTVVLAALWAMLTWCVARTVSDSFEILSWSYITVFVLSKLQLYQVTVFGHLFTFSADALESSFCNVYWMATCICAGGYRIQDVLASLWVKRYKTVI